MDKQWLKIKDIPAFCGISERLARDWLKMGLKYSKIGGIILVKTTDLDDFIEQYSIKETTIE